MKLFATGKWFRPEVLPEHVEYLNAVEGSIYDLLMLVDVLFRGVYRKVISCAACLLLLRLFHAPLKVYLQT